MDRIERAAYLLKQYGIKQGDIITLVLPNIPQTEYIIYGANKIGSIVHLLHALSTKEQIKNNITKTGSKFVFVMDMAANDYLESISPSTAKLFAVSPVGEQFFLKNLIYKKMSHVRLLTSIVDFDKELRHCHKFTKVEVVTKDLRSTSFLFNGSGTNASVTR
ncbi:MAG: AMP-binding protein [Christensenellaceae bacterium]|nr:AMP-binding protein [Christensenellaceae bacterium]